MTTHEHVYTRSHPGATVETCKYCSRFRHTEHARPAIVEVPAEPDMDMTPRYAPDTVMIVNGRHFGRRAVTGSIFYPVGVARPSRVIRDDWGALELKTDGGSSWYGCVRAYINAELRMVVVGTPARDEVRMQWAIVPEDCR